MTALTEERLVEEVLHFPTNCPDCNAPAETNMKMTREFVRRSVSYCAAVHLVKCFGVEVQGDLPASSRSNLPLSLI